MKPGRVIIVCSSVVVIGWTVAGLIDLGVTRKKPVGPTRQPVELLPPTTPSPAAIEPSPAPVPAQTSAPAVTLTVEPPTTPNPSAMPPSLAKVDSRKLPAAPSAAQPAPKPRPNKKAADKTFARFALNYVGMDRDAEQVWIEGINDPSLPPNTRKDLIEDLNEDGFPDPRNITMDDLPLIVSRLQLIEELAPDAMDEINAAAFAEAYKDLVNMYARLMAQ